MRTWTAAATAALALVIVPLCAGAQSGDWEIEWTPLYMWVATGDGAIMARGVTVPVDYDLGDMLDALDYGFATHFEAKTDTWGLLFDLSYAKFSAEAGAAEVDLDMLMVEAAGTFPVSDSVELIAGGRYYDFETTAKLDGTTVGKRSRNWFDPIFGARYSTEIGTGWTFTLRGDIGGFLGSGSDLAWQIMAEFDYDISDMAAITFGLKILSIDYDDGTGDTRFEYDVTNVGPFVGIALSF